jgi:transcriptional regulator with XRE-family HTH domain
MGETKGSAALRDLGAELGEARKKAGLTLRGLAEAADISTHSRISEAEQGRRLLAVDEYERILDVLDITPEDRERIIGVVRSLEGPGEIAVGTPGIGKILAQLVDHERAASRITNVAPLLIPGLLQTDDYARCIIGDNNARVALRAGRGAILTRVRPVEYLALIDSEVFVRPVGPPDVMLHQLDHILALAARPNITMQIVTSTTPGYSPLLAGPCSLIEFEKARPIVFLDHHTSSSILWEASEVAKFVDAVEEIKELAMSPAKSLELIASIANGWRRRYGNDTASEVAKE